MDEGILKQGGLPPEAQRVLTARDDPPGYLYHPPEGAVLMAPPKEGMFYQADQPNQQTDRLQPFERRYIIPIALTVSPIFGVSPITDDIYRKIPEFHLMKNLFCVISRSGIRKTHLGLDWDSVVVVVRKFCVARINTILDPANDRFAIRRILLWSKATQRYEVVEDPQTGVINARVLPHIMEQYNNIEGVAPGGPR